MSYAASGTGDLKKLKGYKSPTWRLRGDCFRAFHQLRGSTINRRGDLGPARR